MEERAIIMSVVLQLSDLHLGRLPEHEAPRREILVDVVRRQSPDLIVISGDLCDDATCQPEQIALGKSMVDALATVAPVHVIPGNHDVGNKPGIAKDALTQECFQRWRTVFGDDWFHAQVAGFAVLGLNSQIMGSGWPVEAEQLHWLDDRLAACDQALVFMHMPPDLPALVDVEPDRREALRYWPVNPEPRAALLERLSSPKVRLLCSGHLHNDAALPHAVPPRRWCPSLSFGVTIPGVTGVVSRGDRIGLLRHELHHDTVTSTLIPVELPVSGAMSL